MKMSGLNELCTKYLVEWYRSSLLAAFACDLLLVAVERCLDQSRCCSFCFVEETSGMAPLLSFSSLLELFPYLTWESIFEIGCIDFFQCWMESVASVQQCSRNQVVLRK